MDYRGSRLSGPVYGCGCRFWSDLKHCDVTIVAGMSYADTSRLADQSYAASVGKHPTMVLIGHVYCVEFAARLSFHPSGQALPKERDRLVLVACFLSQSGVYRTQKGLSLVQSAEQERSPLTLEGDLACREVPTNRPPPQYSVASTSRAELGGHCARNATKDVVARGEHPSNSSSETHICAR